MLKHLDVATRVIVTRFQETPKATPSDAPLQLGQRQTQLIAQRPGHRSCPSAASSCKENTGSPAGKKGDESPGQGAPRPALAEVNASSRPQQQQLEGADSPPMAAASLPQPLRETQAQTWARASSQEAVAAIGAAAMRARDPLPRLAEVRRGASQVATTPLLAHTDGRQGSLKPTPSGTAAAAGDACNSAMHAARSASAAAAPGQPPQLLQPPPPASEERGGTAVHEEELPPPPHGPNGVKAGPVAPHPATRTTPLRAPKRASEAPPRSPEPLSRPTDLGSSTPAQLARRRQHQLMAQRIAAEEYLTVVPAIRGVAAEEEALEQLAAALRAEREAREALAATMAEAGGGDGGGQELQDREEGVGLGRARSQRQQQQQQDRQTQEEWQPAQEQEQVQGRCGPGADAGAGILGGGAGGGGGGGGFGGARAQQPREQLTKLQPTVPAARPSPALTALVPGRRYVEVSAFTAAPSPSLVNPAVPNGGVPAGRERVRSGLLFGRDGKDTKQAKRGKGPEPFMILSSAAWEMNNDRGNPDAAAVGGARGPGMAKGQGRGGLGAYLAARLAMRGGAGANAEAGAEGTVTGDAEGNGVAKGEQQQAVEVALLAEGSGDTRRRRWGFLSGCCTAPEAR